MQFRVVEVALCRLPCRTRLPFRFGAVTLREAPLLHARVLVEAVDGRRGHGLAADLLVPKWFRKDPATTVDEDQQELHASVLGAARVLCATGFATPFELWRQCWRQQASGLAPAAPEHLVRGFGTALLERAVLDAVCQLAQKSLWSALQQDLFSFRPQLVLPQLASFELPAALPERPRQQLLLRHTLGQLDALRRSELADPVDDGLPQALEDDLARHGIRWLKVKLGAGALADRRRLLDLAAFCRERDLDLRFTFDGNEQFASLGELADLLDAVAAEPAGRELLARLAFVEQPLPRASTFDAAANAALDRVQRYAPLLLDEADQEPGSFAQALQQGWRGCSVKNCKGVFRALLNLGVARQAGGGAFLSAEDLTTLGVLSLQQDLATVACLGLEHVERNGQHYFRGLDHLPAAVAAAALREHPDLYAPLGDGATLRVEHGAIACGSLHGRGFGCDPELQAELLRALPFEIVAAADPG